MWKLYKEHHDTLGFMPEGAFSDRAAKGTLLAAIDPSNEDTPVGYALYDLPRRHIALRHLCSDDGYAGQGIARQLVEEIARRHPERLGIRLRCRDDFPAARMWPKLDFEPLDAAPGRSNEGHLLTTWWRDFGHPTLFSSLAEPGERRRVVLDTNIFRDLVEQGRPRESRNLQADWLQDLIELFITKDVVIELGATYAHRGHLHRFPRIEVPEDEWKPVEAEILADVEERGLTIRQNDRMDIRHVARAAAAGADDFATRDEDCIKRLAKIAAGFGVNVTTPAGLIAEVSLQTDPYAPSQIENTTFQLRSAADFAVNTLTQRFLNTPAGERVHRLRECLREALATRASEALVVTGDQESLVALIVRKVHSEELHVPVLRVAGNTARTISRHLVHLQRRHALDTGLTEIRITDPYLSPSLPSALAAEGFISHKPDWRAWTYPQVITSGEKVAVARSNDVGRSPINDVILAQVRDGEVSAAFADDLERLYSPLKVLGAGIRNYLVPIQPAWAGELIDSRLSEDTLFPRPAVLGMSREHVYYSGTLRQLRPPARLIWYVSMAGHRSIRAVSRLEEAVVDRPRTLYRRYEHLGVWKLDQVAKAAGKRGKLLALRFSDTEPLPHPVPLNELRTLALENQHPLVLRSITEIPEQTFEGIYRRGMHGEN